MASIPGGENRYDEAERLLAEFAMRQDAEDPVAFEGFLADHPEVAEELRDLHAIGAAADAALSEEGLQRRASEKQNAALTGVAPNTATLEGRYKVEDEIGRGAMGVILRVVDTRLDRPLAMKVILARAPGPLSGKTPLVSEARMARFVREAKITAQLDHPGIVPVHEFGVDEDGRAFFTMKLVRGITLSDVLHHHESGDPQWSTPRVLRAIERVCDAIAFAHQRSVIHRDLKPANIMVGDFGEVYVMDWGLARRLDRNEESDAASGALDEELNEHLSLTRDGTVLGTPAYMSPEQARGRTADVGTSSDVYSIGAILYHLIAGSPPYVLKGEKLSREQIVARVLSGPAKRIKSPNTPPELIAICERAMAYDDTQRYPDTLALASHLRAHLEHRVVGAYESGAWAEARKWMKRNKPLAASLMAAVLILVAGILTSTAYAVRAEEEARETKREAIRADAQAKLAEEKSTESDLNAARAGEQERLATQRANDVLSLSAIQELKELIERADGLWPALPSKLPEYDRWLSDARTLLEGRPADTAQGISPHPSLKDHRSKLVEIRQRARPRSAEDVERARRASPNFAEWEASRAHVTWIRRMLGEEPWPSESAIALSLRQSPLPTDAYNLNQLAWSLVRLDAPETTYGREVEGLVLARLALAVAEAAERAEIRDTLAWAFFRCGQFDEAIAEEQRAVNESNDIRKSAAEASLRVMKKGIEIWTTDSARAKQADESRKLAIHAANLNRDMDERCGFEFDDAQDRWWHGQLVQLVSDLEALSDEKTGLYSTGASERHGWGIAKRVEIARSISASSTTGPEALRRWNEAIEAIRASAKYSQLVITPQIGMLPIGIDLQSGLWEFSFLPTGDEAQRGREGQLIITEQTGIVFVLIPGGPFLMGAQSTQAGARNYDPLAMANESPVHELTLSPYFLSKYEMTQAQWRRTAGYDPSFFNPSTYLSDWNREQKGWSALHPVENVSWTECTQLMLRLDLLLPTEAQWECGCRAGTHSVYWSASDEVSLREVGNVADDYAKRHGGSWTVNHASWDDGQTCHAAVGAYRANPFGLLDVHGNVFEWCRDKYGEYSDGTYGDDGEHLVAGDRPRVIRGGSFNRPALNARSSHRDYGTPQIRDYSVGLRPAKKLTP